MQKALKPEQRRAQILEFALGCRANNRPQFTATEAARCLGVAPSTKFRAIIRPMVDWGILIEEVEIYVGAVSCRYVYRVAESVWRREERKRMQNSRSIRINGEPCEVASS